MDIRKVDEYYCCSSTFKVFLATILTTPYTLIIAVKNNIVAIN